MQTEKINKNRTDKRSNSHLYFLYRIEYTFYLSLINKVCEYPTSQQYFLIISHKSNNKEIVPVCLLRNTTICFHIKIKS